MENEVTRYLEGVIVVIQVYLSGTLTVLFLTANRAGQQICCPYHTTGVRDASMAWWTRGCGGYPPLLARVEPGWLSRVSWCQLSPFPFQAWEHPNNILKGIRQKWGEPCTWGRQLWGQAGCQDSVPSEDESWALGVSESQGQNCSVVKWEWGIVTTVSLLKN